MQEKESQKLVEIYDRLYKTFGPQYWWPAKTFFEVIVGAILTQNTNWGNVEKALNNLRKNKKLNPSSLNNLSHSKLAEFIRPAGFFNIKSKRLKNFLNFFFSEYSGNIQRMKKESLPILREKLLSINGIGPETADSILLYALDKPVFVVDSYTKRVLSRHEVIGEDSNYSDLQKLFMDNLKKDVQLFNEYHALIVRVCKEYCRAKPLCDNCPLCDIN